MTISSLTLLDWPWSIAPYHQTLVRDILYPSASRDVAASGSEADSEEYKLDLLVHKDWYSVTIPGMNYLVSELLNYHVRHVALSPATATATATGEIRMAMGFQTQDKAHRKVYYVLKV